MKSAPARGINERNVDRDNGGVDGERSKVHNNSECLVRRRRPESIVSDVHRMDSCSLEETDKIVVTTTHRAQRKGCSILWFMFYTLLAVTVGFASGYFIALVLTGDGMQDIELLADNYQKISRSSDGRRCRAELQNVPKIVKKFNISPAKLWSVANKLDNDHRDIECLLMHFATSSALVSQTENKATCDDINLTKCHSQALKMVKRINKSAKVHHSQRNCMLEAYKSVILQIVKVCVFDHKEAVFRRTWDNVGCAIAHSRVSDWKGAKKKSREAMLMMENTFGRNSSEYEVYGWAKHINDIANSRAGPDIDKVAVNRAMAWSNVSEFSFREITAIFQSFEIDVDGVLEDAKKKITASESLALAEDKLHDVNFKPIMKSLFPFDISK